MNWVDLAILGVLAVSGLLGLSRGFVREVLGLGAWALAAFGAWRLGPALQPAMEKAIGEPDVADASAYVVAFLLLLIVLSIAANLVGRAVRISALGGLDHTLGLVFGLARGALIAVAAYVMIGVMLPDTSRWPAPVQNARSLPLLHAGAVWLTGMIPDQFRPRVAAPPGGDTPTTAASLLHATPEGRALGPPASHD